MQKSSVYYKAQSFRPVILAIVLFLGLFLPQSQAVTPATANKGVQVVNYITWWSLAPTGYHPAILLKLENNTGVNLTGQPIAFQGRFMDLQTAQVFVARDKEQQQFLPKQRILVWLKCPDAFELPLDVSHWPNLECKVMCRVKNIDDDETTQDLTITPINKLAMSDDDARQQLEKMREYTQSLPAKFSSDTKEPLLHASKSVHQNEALTLSQQLHNLPGLGDDFALFERSFGLPTATDAGSWTWATYNAPALKLTIHAGSSGKTGKVDILVCEMLKKYSQNNVIDIVRAFSNKFKAQQLSPVNKSVRYLPQGRTELLTANTAGYTMTYVARSETQALIISAIHKDILPFLLEQSKTTPSLQSLQEIFEL